MFHDTKPTAALKRDWIVIQKLLRPLDPVPYITATKTRLLEEAAALAATVLVFNL